MKVVFSLWACFAASLAYAQKATEQDLDDVLSKRVWFAGQASIDNFYENQAIGSAILRKQRETIAAIKAAKSAHGSLHSVWTKKSEDVTARLEIILTVADAFAEKIFVDNVVMELLYADYERNLRRAPAKLPCEINWAEVFHSALCYRVLRNKKLKVNASLLEKLRAMGKDILPNEVYEFALGLSQRGTIVTAVLADIDAGGTVLADIADGGTSMKNGLEVFKDAEQSGQETEQSIILGNFVAATDELTLRPEVKGYLEDLYVPNGKELLTRFVGKQAAIKRWGWHTDQETPNAEAKETASAKGRRPVARRRRHSSRARRA